MDINRPRDVALFSLGLGTLAFLASALWSAFFLTPVNQDPDWCREAVEVESGRDGTAQQCVAFKNELEQLKYYHNLSVRDRNKFWVYGLLAVGALVGVFVFYTIPRWRGTLDRSSESLFGGILVGILVVLIVPTLLSWLLPPPAEWFPREIREISEMRRDAILRELERAATGR